MGRRIAIGVAWWLPLAYAFQVGVYYLGLPMGLGLIVAIPAAALIAAAVPQRARRPADNRRIYQPKAETPVTGAERSILTGR